MDFAIGSLIDDKYKVQAVLGSGGMGRVYKAEQEDLNRIVAVKVLSYLANEEEESFKRFQQEARILSALEHDKIVKVYSFGLLNQTHPYMVMEYIEGESLDQILRNSGPLDWNRVLSIGIQIADAVAFMHEHGVLHRDLKPQNILIYRQGQADSVKVLDFGLSKVIESRETIQKLTATGALIGSVHYMSPELCQGKKADERSDIYSLACTVYECLSGRTPVLADHVISVISKQISEMPPRFKKLQVASGAPPELELLVFKGLQKNPEKRFQSMSEFRNSMAILLSGNTALPGLRTDLLDMDGNGKSSRLALLAGAVLLLITTGFLCNAAMQKIGQTQEAEKTNKPKHIDQQKRALALVEEAKTFLVQGNKYKAAALAKYAFFLIIKSESPTAYNQKVRLNLRVMKEVAEIISQTDSKIEISESTVRFLNANLNCTPNGQDHIDFFESLALLQAKCRTPMESIKALFSYCERSKKEKVNGARFSSFLETYQNAIASNEFAERIPSFASVSKISIEISKAYLADLQEDKGKAKKLALSALNKLNKDSTIEMEFKQIISTELAQLLDWLDLNSEADKLYRALIPIHLKMDTVKEGLLFDGNSRYADFLLKEKRYEDAIKVMEHVIIHKNELRDPAGAEKAAKKIEEIKLLTEKNR